MNKIEPEHLAQLTVYIECIHEILYPYKDYLRFDIKKAYNNIDKAVNHILRHSYGDQLL